MLNQILPTLSVLLLLGLAWPQSTAAVCPICTVAVGAGVGLSRWVGIDDSVTGLWVGGLIVSMIVWTVSWLDKKGKSFRGIWAVTIAIYYVLVLLPLYWSGLMNSTAGNFIGMSRLTAGIIVGSLGFWSGASWYLELKRRNGGHAMFPFQKVVMPIIPLIVMSIIFYLMTK